HEKTIKLKRAYDEAYFKNHTDGSGCKLQNGVVSILNFFSPTLKENQPITKRYTCTKLDSPIYKAYINQVFAHTTYSGAPRREVIARELFSKKFSLDKAQYTINSSRLCDYCKEVQNNQVFKNAVTKQDIQNSKKKFMPKIQLRSNPIAKYIYNQDIARVKRLVDTIEYAGPIIAMLDNTKIKERLDIIKSCNAIASQVHVYLLQ
ncbi:1304_t:CDS:2, partial [Dentiscutata erythropus]